jgi:hypothetical protein
MHPDGQTSGNNCRGGGEELSPRLGKRHFDATLQALAVASIFYHVWAIHNAGYGKPDLDRF